MKRKLPTILILLTMILLGAMHWIDRSYYTDAATGLVTRGAVWVRYLILLLPVIMALLGLSTVGPRAIAVLRVRSKALACLFVLASVCGVSLGIAQLFYAFTPFSVYRIILGILFVFYGVWMFFAALQLFAQTAPSPTKNVLWGIIASLPFCALTIYRIMINPSSLHRTAPFIATISALISLLWFSMLLRAFYISMPQGRARGTYFLGVLCFLFGTCLEMPQSIHASIFMGQSALPLLESVNVGVLGLVAGCISVAIAGQAEEQLQISEE